MTQAALPLVGDELTGADADDYQHAFDASACFCEAQTVDYDGVSANVIMSGDSGLAGDAALTDWIDRRDSGELACSDLGNRPAQPVATSSGNACVPAPLAFGPITIASDRAGRGGGAYAAGLCRPEMNYCLGQELSRRAHSLATAPRSRAVRDALLAEASSRFEAAGVEMAAVTAFLGDFCVQDPMTRPHPEFDSECQRLTGDATHRSYFDHAFSVISDSVMQLGDLVDELALSAHEAGDAVAPGLARSPGDYVDDVWGRDSARYRAMQVLMGSDDDALVAYGRADGSAQEGDVLLEDFEREQRLWPMEPGVILRARALNAERVLTNPLSSADRGLVAPYERTEFWGRPLRGTYTLRIHGRPEVQWSNLEDVQILLDYRYWTRQE
ncbi:MAG: hypothetical protein GXP55_11910 [Deltaproteobacteria bacterium]|nr:hypothetical protein [Deltaproteobacteria bacterium]